MAATGGPRRGTPAASACAIRARRGRCRRSAARSRAAGGGRSAAGSSIGCSSGCPASRRRSAGSWPSAGSNNRRGSRMRRSAGRWRTMPAGSSPIPASRNCSAPARLPKRRSPRCWPGARWSRARSTGCWSATTASWSPTSRPAGARRARRPRFPPPISARWPPIAPRCGSSSPICRSRRPCSTPPRRCSIRCPSPARRAHAGRWLSRRFAHPTCPETTRRFPWPPPLSPIPRSTRTCSAHRSRCSSISGRNGAGRAR